MRTKLLMGSAALAMTAAATLAVAAERDTGNGYFQQSVTAPANAVELTLGGGYTQGFGQLAKGGANNINDVANAGGAIDFGVASRVTPRMSIGVNGAYQQYSTGRTIDTESTARGAVFGIDGQYHFSPYRRVDPWLKVGVGYRMLWQNPSAGTNVLIHGFELAKVQFGIDVRTTPMLAIGPMIGADLNLLLWERPQGGSNSAITDPRLNTFVFAGVQARFDAGGTSVSESSSGNGVAKR